MPIVDVITGGSPCQDLSVAGKRAGLDGERSGLFMEQIRIVKEMREHDKRDNRRTDWLIRPRYMVWENVPGAFSSNGGEDFKTVLEEIVKIVEPDVPDLRTVVSGGWTKAGCLYSEMGTWSIAWRVHDAQFWGVPQRRKRIALVADFGGLSAPEILFERKGLSRNLEPCGKAKEGAAGGTEASSDRTICLQGNGIDRADTAGCNGAGWRRGGSYTLNTIDRPAVMVFEQNQREEVRDLGGVSSAIKAEPGTHNQTFVAGFKAGQSKDGGIGYAEEQSPTLSATPSALEPTVICAGFVGNQGSKAHGIAYELEKSPTLKAGGVDRTA